MGIAWAVTVAAALSLGRLAFGFPVLCVVLAVVAAAAAAQVVEAWHPARSRALRITAAIGAGAVGMSAAFGSRPLGAVVVVVVGCALVVCVVQATRRFPLFALAALVLQAVLPVGMAVACVQLTLDHDIGSAIILLMMVMAFDLADFVVGSGASGVFEGPIAGAIAIVLIAAVAAVINAPPFDGAMVWLFAALAAVLCPLGQVAASWLLPDATTRASALRRLDSLLVIAPVWTVLVTLIATRH